MADTLAEIESIRRKIASVAPKMEHARGVLEAISPKTMAAEIDKSLKLLHSRLDKLENQQKTALEQAKRAETAFANALLGLSERVEKISGGKDSKFSLAHSLEELIRVMKGPVSVKRDRNGNMIGWEAE